MSLAGDLQEALREFAAAGPVELRDNGARVAPLSTLSWEIRGNADKPLLHLWSENHNLTRRVLAITGHSEQRLALAVECFGRLNPDRLEFLRVEFEHSPVELGRQAFAEAVKRLCEREFPDDSLESLSTSADLEHSLSGNFVRGVLRRGREAWALFVVPDSQEAQDAARCLTFALLWFDRLHRTADRRAIGGIRIVLPSGTTTPLAHLLASLRPDLRVQLFAREAVMETLQRIEPSEVANCSSRLVAARETQALLHRARLEMNQLLPGGCKAISLHANVSAGEVIVRFRGLSCIRWHESGIFFGVRDMKTRLHPCKEKHIHAMLRELEMHRHPLATDLRQPLYRMQSERWLEFLVREDVTRVDAMLDQQFAYTQVLATSGSAHGILDVLTATRSGRLAILELKTGEDPVFLLQAVKYWLRIKRHLEQGDLARCGYFSQITLQPSPPLIYLVGPALRFHPATGNLLRYLHPQIEVVRVGLAESWRKGLTVVLRQ